jgi:hypothetical protein
MKLKKRTRSGENDCRALDISIIPPGLADPCGKQTYRRLVPVEDLQRRTDARLPEVPVLLWAVVSQQAHQSRNIHVVVVIEVTEPSVGNTGKLSLIKETRGHLNNGSQVFASSICGNCAS